MSEKYLDQNDLHKKGLLPAHPRDIASEVDDLLFDPFFVDLPFGEFDAGIYARVQDELEDTQDDDDDDDFIWSDESPPEVHHEPVEELDAYLESLKKTASRKIEEKKKTEKIERIKGGPGYLVWEQKSPEPKLNKDDRGRTILRSKAPFESAYLYQKKFGSINGIKTVHFYKDRFYKWDGISYQSQSMVAYRSNIVKFLADCCEYDKKDDCYVDYSTVSSRKKEILEALADRCYINHETLNAPAWLTSKPNRPHPKEIICCKNGLLDVRRKKILPPTPEYFTTNAINMEHDPDAPTPKRWLRFLNDVLPGDADCQRLIKWWFGYCLTVDTRQQKILYIKGAPRSGKGTMLRILQRLVGPQNYGTMRFDALEKGSALSSMVDKSILAFPDIRLDGRKSQSAIIESLLSISGEDEIYIDVKHKDPLSVKLNTRIILVSNDLIKLVDSSGALTNRLLLCNLTESFLGREDLSLEDDLVKELPGIMNWAIEGWHELQQNGKFIQPASAQPLLELFGAQASPVREFVSEYCHIGHDKAVPKEDLYIAWKVWCENSGHRSGAKNTFSRNLFSAYPKISAERRMIDGNRNHYFTGIDLSDNIKNDIRKYRQLMESAFENKDQMRLKVH